MEDNTQYNVKLNKRVYRETLNFPVGNYVFQIVTSQDYSHTVEMNVDHPNGSTTSYKLSINNNTKLTLKEAISLTIWDPFKKESEWNFTLEPAD